MCKRFNLTHSREEIEEYFQVTLPGPFGSREVIHPVQPILIIRENEHCKDGLEVTHVTWGLIPPWAEDISIGRSLVNARIETAHEKPSFKNALKRRRCIIPATGFFAWEQDPHDPDKRKSWYCKSPDGAPLSLAGLWEVWHGPNGEMLESATILTQKSEGPLADIQDRMPVIIPRNSVPTWLDKTDEKSKLSELSGTTQLEIRKI